VWRDKGRRWALVVAVAAVLVTLPTVVSAFQAPVGAVDPERLRALILASDGQPHEGYAEAQGKISVPDLPNLDQVTSLINGTTRIRTWYDSPARWRFDVLTIGAERDVYGTPGRGFTVWTPDGGFADDTSATEFVWDYGANLLTEVVGEQPVRLPRAGDLLPPDLARRVLRAAPSDPVEPIEGRRVAGISAAGLRLRPADPDTAIGRIDIWADPATGLPVRVAATARGAEEPFLLTEFLDLSLTRPDPDTLTPKFPADSGYNLTAAPDIVTALGTRFPPFFPDRLAGRSLRTDTLAGVPGVGLYGPGLSAFVAIPLPGGVASSATDAARKAGATDLTLPNGTAVRLTVAPVSVLVVRASGARRSYLLAGMVQPDVLDRAAAELSTLARGRR
jgi:hypothetical protein